MNNDIIEQPSWWKRNWKWALPTGGCLTMIVGCIVIVGIGAFGVVKAIKENTNSNVVVAKVQQDDRVIDALGTPIETTSIGSFNITIKNGERTANAVIPIKGPKGTGEIYINTSGEKENPVYEKVEVYLMEQDSIINLESIIPELEASSRN